MQFYQSAREEDLNGLAMTAILLGYVAAVLALGAVILKLFA